jgi:hypothetical protein
MTSLENLRKHEEELYKELRIAAGAEREAFQKGHDLTHAQREQASTAFQIAEIRWQHARAAVLDAVAKEGSQQ